MYIVITNDGETYQFKESDKIPSSVLEDAADGELNLIRTSDHKEYLGDDRWGEIEETTFKEIISHD